MLRIVLLAFVILAAHARAAGAQTDAECRTAMAESAPQTLMNICAARTAAEADERLNALLVRLQRGLPPGRWKRLARVQQRWVAYRDAACDYEGDLYRGGSGQPYAISTCFTRITQARIADLKGSIFELGL